MQIGLLKSNFQELYSSLHQASGQLSLVANYSGTRLYDSTKCWGRLWFWFYQFTDRLFCCNLRLNKLKQAFIHTHQIFHNHLPALQIHLNNYQQYLTQLSSGYLTDENAMQNDRKAIINWNNGTKKFTSFFHHTHHKKMQQFVRCCFKKKSTSTLFTTPLTSTALIYSRIIALECISAASLPLTIFKKIYKNKPLHTIETKELKKWIDKLNLQKTHINTIHKGFFAITEFFNTHQTSKGLSNYHPKTLENFLQTAGCSIFEQSDSKQINWRKQTWKQNKTLCEGKTLFKIGKPLGYPTTHIDHSSVFELLSHPENSALIPSNRVKLFLTESKPEHFPIATAKIIQIMKRGRWALIERLSPISSITWKSNTSSIAQEDQSHANELASLIKKCVETNATPKDLSLSNLMFDTQGHLKSLYPMTIHTFDFNALENFAYRASRGNLTIFKYLMQTSGLINHSTAKYYLAVATATLQKKNVNLANLGGIYHISDSQVIDKASSFAKSLTQLQKQLTTTIQDRFPALEPEIIRKKIIENLLTHYQECCTASFLWSTVAKSILKTFSHQ